MKFELPTLIYQEKNCVNNHANELTKLGTKALIITGHSSAKRNGAYQDICNALDSLGITHVLFDEIEENPSVATCVNAAKVGLSENVDFCIGIGGGSPLDAAKAIALLLGNQTTDPTGFYQPELYSLKALPVVCVPTTAGTGSEATPFAILTLHDQHTKKSISHRIYPKLSLCDPKYLHFVPEQILRNTAVDTLAHLIESYLNTNASVYSRMFVEAGLKLWGEVHNDLTNSTLTNQSYEKLMEASTIAGMAITHTSTSIPHGLSYPVTYENNVPHGASCGLFLPGYLTFCKEKEIAKIEPKSPAMTSSDCDNILYLLGLHSISDFSNLLHTLLGNISLSKELWEKDVDLLMENPVKLKNCPYAITREELLKFFSF